MEGLCCAPPLELCGGRVIATQAGGAALLISCMCPCCRLGRPGGGQAEAGGEAAPSSLL